MKAKSRLYAYPFRDEDAQNRIREWRRARGLTLEALADRLAERFPESARNFTKDLVSDWETGRTGGGLDLRNLRMVAAVLDVNVTDLLAARDNPYPPTPEEKEIFEIIRRMPPGRRQEAMSALAGLARAFVPEPEGGAPGRQESG